MTDQRKRRDEKPEVDSGEIEDGAERNDDSLQQNPTKPRRRRLSERGVGSEHAQGPQTFDSSPTSKTRF